MRLGILEAIGGWSKFVQTEPLWGVLLSLAASLALITALSWVLGLRLKSAGDISSGPIFVVAGLIVLGVCTLWTAVDAVMWATDAPYLSERFFRFLMPDSMQSSDALRDVLAIKGDGGSGRLLLPAAVSMSVGLLVATGLYILLTLFMGSTLAELASLEMKPADVLRRERKQELAAMRKAIAAGQPPPVHTISRTPLPNDRFGRIYKLLGHWSNVEFVETRFIRWQKVVIRTLYILMFISILAALFRYMPIAMWVGTAIVTTALTRNLKTPKQPREHDDDDEPDPEESVDSMASAPAFVDQVEVIAHLTDAPEPPPIAHSHAESQVEVKSQHLLDDVCSALGIDEMHSHQAIAVQQFEERKSVLLATSPMSGRGALGDALVLYTVLAEAERVLYLTPDVETSGEVEARFAERAEATHWKWNILSVDLADRAGKIDPTQAQPSLVFADPVPIHRQLCARADRWQTFLSGLGLIVIPDLHRYSGVRAAHLAHLFRRLMRQIHRARMTAFGRGLEPVSGSNDHVRFLVTCDPGYSDAARYTERIIGQPVHMIGYEADDSPRPDQDAKIVSPQWGKNKAVVHPALALRDLAREKGAAAELEGYDDLFSEAEIAPGRSLRDAEVVITRMSAARYPSLPMLTSHLGAFSSKHDVAVLWQPDREPFAELLAEERPPLDHPDLRRGCSLVAWPKTRAVERTHLLCSLAEGEVTLDELSRLFSRDVLADQLRELRDRGTLVEREHRLLDVKKGSVITQRTATLATSEDMHTHASLTVCGTPWQLVERSTGDIVCELDGQRASAAAYPNRVLVRGGRRFAVLAAENQDQIEQRRILCEVTEEELVTSPIREYAVQLVERRGTRASEPPDDRRKRVLSNIGGVGFGFQHRDVDVVEQLLGVRRFNLDGSPRDETLYDSAQTFRYPGRAALVHFPPDVFGEVNNATLEALVNLFSAVLPVFIRYSEEDLIVTPSQLRPLEGTARPVVVFLDLHPEGAGFAEVVNLDVIRHLVAWSLALVRRGSASAVNAPRSHATAEVYGTADRAGAEAVLAALVGESVPERKPASVDSGTDP